MVREKLVQQANRENMEIAFEGGTIVYNYDEDRLQILFDAVPDSDMRTKLKGNAFKWPPRNQAWQRQLTQNAVIAAYSPCASAMITGPARFNSHRNV